MSEALRTCLRVVGITVADGAPARVIRHEQNQNHGVQRGRHAALVP